MELEIYQAFTRAGVSESDAKAAAESINRAIDQRHAVHSHQLATRGDLTELHAKNAADLAALKTDLMKWSIGTVFASVGLFATVAKLWH